MRIFIALVLCAVACSSSSTSPPPPSNLSTCFAGSYTVTFDAETGGDCGDLRSTAAAWIINVDGAGNVLVPAPPGATARAGSAFDASTCRASYAFTRAADACADESFSYDLTFNASGFGGTYTFAGCGVSCSYPIHGAKH